MKFIYQGLNGGKYLGQKSRIVWIEFCQRLDGFLRHDQDMEWICGLWVTKRDQCFRLMDALNRQEKIHSGDYPTGQYQAGARIRKPHQKPEHGIRSIACR